MITQSTRNVPLYPCKIKVIIYDKSKELEDKYKMANGTEGGFFHSCDNYLNHVIAIKSSSGAIAICHESEHIKNRIFYAIGYDTQQLNDEADAYLLSWIAGFVTEIYWKHKKRNKK